jgi:hypothetical protein
MIASRSLKHIGDEFSGNRCSRFIFFVLPGIWETGNDSSDATSRGSATGIYHNEEFHEVVVDRI